MSTQTKEELEKQKAEMTAGVKGQKTEAEAAGQETAEQPTEQKKKRRRGVTNDTRATSRLKFDERRDVNTSNGLFIGHLDNVEIQWVTIGTEVTGLPQFAGLSIPLLILTFASNHENENERRYCTLRLMPAESNALTIIGGKESWKVDTVTGWLKHVLDTFVFKGRAMTEAEEDALSLPFEDSDENGQYVPVEAEEVIAGWKALFENFVNMLNHDGKPYYRTLDGKYIPIWMKLLRYTKRKNNWEPVVRGKSTMGDLGFSTFVGEGAIELYKESQEPKILRVDVSKESVRHRETAAARPATPGIPGNPMMGGSVPQMPMGGSAAPMGGNAFTAGNQFAGNPADDLPF